MLEEACLPPSGWKIEGVGKEREKERTKEWREGEREIESNRDLETGLCTKRIHSVTYFLQ